MFRYISLCLVPVLYAGTAAAQDTAYQVRGQVTAPEAVTLAAGMTTKISAFKVRAGSSFRKGDLLVELDCAKQQATRGITEAKLKGARIKEQNIKHLLSLDAVGPIEANLAAIETESLEAEIVALDAALRHCQIMAPYDGAVGALYAAAHQYVREGDQLLDLVPSGGLEVELVVPSQWLAWLKVGQSFSLTLDETGESMPVRVSRLGASIDPVSQTIQVFGSFHKAPETVLRGMSGVAQFLPPEG